jgi:hypothetical protein
LPLDPGYALLAEAPPFDDVFFVNRR